MTEAHINNNTTKVTTDRDAVVSWSKSPEKSIQNAGKVFLRTIMMPNLQSQSTVGKKVITANRNS